MGSILKDGKLIRKLLRYSHCHQDGAAEYGVVLDARVRGVMHLATVLETV